MSDLLIERSALHEHIQAEHPRIPTDPDDPVFVQHTMFEKLAAAFLAKLETARRQLSDPEIARLSRDLADRMDWAIARRSVAMSRVILCWTLVATTVFGAGCFGLGRWTATAPRLDASSCQPVKSDQGHTFSCVFVLK